MWDANWITSKGKGKLTRRTYNQLQAAIAERSQAVGRAVVGSQKNKYERVRKSDRLALHNEVTALISYYIDHTDNDGNWEGQSIIPYWTESDILTAIGDTARIPAPNNHINVANWGNQTRKIINMLRWTRVDIDTIDYRFKWSGWQGDYATAKTTFESAVFTDSLGGGRTYGSVESSGYSIAFKDESLSFNLNIDADVILYSTFHGYFAPFFSRGYVFNANIYYNMYEGTHAVGVNSTGFCLFDNRPINTYPPEPPVKGSWSDALGEYFLIAKFDATNGFQYKDW